MNKYFLLTAILLVSAAILGGILTTMNEPRAVQTTNQVQNVNSTANQNIGIPQTYGPAIVFTGKVVPFTSAFQQPDTTGWKSFDLRGQAIPYNAKFTECFTDFRGEMWYLLPGPCQGNQDPPAVSVQDITKKVEAEDPDLLYTYTKDTQIPIEHQFRSDEIRGTINGNSVWCYDDIQARYCEIRRSDGTIYFAVGGYFHEAGQIDQETFTSIILQLVQ